MCVNFFSSQKVRNISNAPCIASSAAQLQLCLHAFLFVTALLVFLPTTSWAQLKLNNPSTKPINPPSSSSGTGLSNPIANAVSTPRDFIVAVVDSVPITNHDVNVRLELQRTQAAQQGRTILKSDVTLRDALEKLITEKALLQNAKDTGVVIDDEALDLAEQRQAAQNQTTVEAMRAKTLASGSSLEKVRKDLHDQLMLQRFVERNVPGRIRITDVEIDNAIKSREKASVSTAAEMELGHIFISVPENSSDARVAELRAKAQSALERVQRGGNFGAIAKEVSQGPEKENNGLMGVRPADRYPSLFVDAVASLRIGEVAPLVQSGAGFHILKLVSKRTVTNATITETRARHILLRPGGQLSQTAARAQLATYKTQIESGRADFAQLAQQHSQDASAAGGGDLGWVAPGMFVPEFEEVMNKLQIGQIADPLVSRFGVHLVQVLARREAPITERELRDLVRNSLREKKYDETYQLWAQEVRGRAYIEYRDPPL
jgi:peptidyl-prolyl cis-trans isomerase SurA